MLSISFFLYERTKIKIEIGCNFSNISIICTDNKFLFQGIGY
ncbi:hypothetical protein LEP1GSC084_1243 [Leptospira interrogans serovar Medanensis str. L0448]|nr:hypothetical protein LEP1GSC099_2243 [Leptospira interrogans str. UI 08452]EMN35711.1 hypothetical protein LEP1GSC084_1243 [Leptospira interrogans serovar Medanensis str. L0448]EMN40493.1 hypothetical protein LEP1GSC085_0362 [Leptospira interrogans str. L0996]EMN50343.1 hypothetical protein LEP1GSC088_3101 [Leptospira interrogans str. L1207]